MPDASLETTESVERRIQDALARLDIPYEVMACDPELADTAEFCRHYGVPLEVSANTIVVASKSGEKRYAACVLLAHTRLDVNKVVRKRLGTRRISFASADETRELTGMVPGGVMPVALPGGRSGCAGLVFAQWLVLDPQGGGAVTRALQVTVQP